jgi:serine/threonine protein kinase
MSAEKEPAESLIGTVLDGSYRIEGLIGEGGMGAVYEAKHLRLDKRVAVKVMVRGLAANAEALTRFHRGGLLTVIQRNSGDMRLNPHLHVIALDGLC